MDIAIIPGATVAVVRIKIKAKVTNIDTDINTYTKWKLLYKPIYNHNYFETEELQYNSPGVYGYGPLFYDLTNLEPNTKYCIKLVITECDESITIRETSEKSFTTVSEGTFAFKSREYNNSTDTQEEFNNILDWFENCMIASGYDYNITNERTEKPFRDNIASPKVIADADYLSGRGAGGTASNKGDITLKYFNINSNYDKHVILHEFRHFLGLSENDIQYHGDCWHNYGTWHRTGYGSGYGYFPQAIEYYNNICKVTSFSRGVDTEDMEIYMYYGENSVDSIYIPDSSGWRYLGFMLLKALGLNDIYIAYNDPVTYYDYEINVSPSNISNISYTWYEKDDNDNLVSIENETNNTIHTTMETIWVKVSADGYEEETVELDKDNRTKSITIESSNVDLYALPITKVYGYSDADTTTEHTIFPIVVYNSGNKATEYSLTIENQYNIKPYYKIFPNQIDIGDEYSIFVCGRHGYDTSGNNVQSEIGTYKINSPYANNEISSKIYSSPETDHNPYVRSMDYMASTPFEDFKLIPYSQSDINISTPLAGLTDCAGKINNSLKEVYFYDRTHETPVDKKTFNCCNFLKCSTKPAGGTYNYNTKIITYHGETFNNEITEYYDGQSMISNMSIDIKVLYSDFNYTITPNSLDRLRFGVARLTSSTVFNGISDGPNTEFISSILQESKYLRFMIGSSLMGDYSISYARTEFEVLDFKNDAIGKQYTISGKNSGLTFLSDLEAQNLITVSCYGGTNITHRTRSNNTVEYSFEISDSSSYGFTVTIINNILN